jgi:NADH dehydrogenase
MQSGETSAPAVLSAAFGRAPLTIGVTGGTGFVGRSLITRLIAAGHSVRAATRNAARADALMPLSSVEVFAGNVDDPAFLRRVFDGCDAVINLVGILNERGFGGGGFRRAHVTFVAGLLQAMRQSNVRRLLHMSALNADAARGRSYYLRSKGAAEQLIHAETALQWTIFRPSVIFGAEDSLTTRFAALLRQSGGWLPLARAGARFAPIFVDDVALAFLRALDDARAVGTTYELCGPDVLTLGQLVREIARAARLPCHVLALPDAVAWLQGAIMGLIPGKPFSLDNLRSLQTDSVCQQDGCQALGIRPASLKAWVPLWLAPSPADGTAPDARADRV